MQRNDSTSNLNVPIPFLQTVKPLDQLALEPSKNGVSDTIEQHPITIIRNGRLASLIIPTVDNFHVWFENVCQISANILTAICDLKSLPHL